MAKKPTSALHELFVSLRRVVILIITAFALAMEWPLDVVAIRVISLWAILVIMTHAAEIMFQYLSHRALVQEHAEGETQASSGAAGS